MHKGRKGYLILLKGLRDREVKRISKTVFSKEVASILITLGVNRNPK
ncbi:MAG TPA: hypothetical protein PK874_11775 [Desulfobacteraceae bacterium]|nr:hypothetical protein [Desulfobacteraceae bacterium]HPJ66745.1 hypothetical protein [Desulfobacteraceae bacterium]HPQ29926.1 hypothetical protein [Desulfobacteraceae bacterium]